MKTTQSVDPKVKYPGAQEATIEFLTWLIDKLFTMPDEEPLSTETIIAHIMEQKWHEGAKLLIMFYTERWTGLIFYQKNRGMKREEVIEMMRRNIADEQARLESNG